MGLRLICSATTNFKPMKEISMRVSSLVLPFVAAGAAIAAMALATPGESHADPSPSITFDQQDFPCQEDEVLGYSPEFGPDRVGCIHIDVLKEQ
ncbi:hypothetical protein SEA_BLINN1_90 [Mycobacterium phage Blinn1]|uniref:Uncharacterized protein n=1 Tax=Mycobacterium phage Blinn1 TaxID=2656562 RepID=A0A649VQS2_9CAUD|nr:hypothetical protein KIP53_gp019 [Mycobacterium phage Blinn1]QGJ94850.1 hypothetical protein SEA_BLINN1_90 [Mycobacterium phage Blinn1]